MRAAFTVGIDIPPNASMEEAESYILDAVKSWRGSLQPSRADGDGGIDLGDPMFDLDPTSVHVMFKKGYKSW